MDGMTLGKRIGILRREQELKQDDLARMLAVSPQAVSKWENDQTCPDIGLLPELARILHVTVDELLSGKQEEQPVVTLVPEEKRKDIKDMMFRVTMDSDDGNEKIRVNLPLLLFKVALESGIGMPQFSGNAALEKIDWKQILALVECGAVGNLVEMDCDGEKIRVFVE